MKIYKSYQKAFLFEIIIGLLTLFTVVLWGVLGFIILALFGFRPLILEIINKQVDDLFWFRHYNLIKLSVVLTSGIIIIVYAVSDLYMNAELNADIFLRVSIPFFILIHGIVGIFFFRTK